MAELINAKCPNCGAKLKLSKKLDRASCTHCGGEVIIAKDEVHYHSSIPLYEKKVEEIKKIKKIRKQRISKRNFLIRKKKTELDPVEKFYEYEIKKANTQVRQLFYIAIFISFIINITFIVFNLIFEIICMTWIILFLILLSLFLFMTFSKEIYITYRLKLIDRRKGLSKTKFERKKSRIKKEINSLDLEINKLNKKLGITGYNPNEEVDVEKFRLKI